MIFASGFQTRQNVFMDKEYSKGDVSALVLSQKNERDEIVNSMHCLATEQIKCE